MLKKILLATDGSDHSLKAADFALKLTQAHDCRVEILFVVQKISNPDMEIILKSGKDITRIKENMKEQGKEIIVITAKKFIELNLPYESKIEIGDDPADVICRKAETEGIDLIVMGTRGHKGIKRFFLGSVSSKVVSHAPCSVSVIR